MYIKKSRFAVCIIVVVVLTAVVTVVALNPFGIGNVDDFLKFSMVSKVIGNVYYDEIDGTEAAETAIAGVAVATGDPYTAYYWGDTAKEYMENISGDYVGVGLYIENDTEENLVSVVSAIAGGSAEEAGITTGDKILEIDGTPYTGEELSDASDYMRGEEGTEVTLLVRKASNGAKEEMTLVRKRITIDSVESKMIGNDIGYISISQFTENVSVSFAEELEELNKSGMQYLVIDLRNNPGGLLDEAVAIASMFIDTGDVITYTSDKSEKRENYRAYDALGDNRKYEIPVVVLTNGGSASASEVLAGALKDKNLAVTIGEKTYGKGIVQSVMEVGENEILSVTVARYFLPSGICIHGTGIDPDIKVELSPEKSAKISDLTLNEDLQLSSAIDYFK